LRVGESGEQQRARMGKGQYIAHEIGAARHFDLNGEVRLCGDDLTIDHGEYLLKVQLYTSVR
jgi:hypothetical protein